MQMHVQGDVKIEGKKEGRVFGDVMGGERPRGWQTDRQGNGFTNGQTLS